MKDYATKFTADEKAKEAEREVKMRERVYGRAGQISPDNFRRIQVMQEIAADYRVLAERDRLI